ncbi:MAG: hydantoinase B/oxoprolinase family protein, partial [Actinomycetota bacterium]|nr:hydantoinase B/oxoprolinase family protein [Actinomycetota bacterium]
MEGNGREMEMDAASLEIFHNLLAEVAEEMGVVLGRSAHSANIKERRDFSCAVFDARGRLVSQAAHIPVHLGALPTSMRALVEWLGGQARVVRDLEEVDHLSPAGRVGVVAQTTLPREML